MNIKMMIFSGIMTALIGAMLGLAVNHISQRESRRPLAVMVGVGLGLAIGIAYETIQQHKHEEADK